MNNIKIFFKTNKQSVKLLNISLKLFQVIHMQIRNFKHMYSVKKKIHDIFMFQKCE